MILRRALRRWLATAALVLCEAAVAQVGQGWPALRDVDLEVPRGNVLDFSSLVEPGPAGKHGWARTLPDGHIGFENRPAPQRFFSASFQFAPSNGGFPSRDEAKRIAQQLVRTGYNAVRLQCVEQNLMSGRTQDFDYSPEQLDRFFSFLAELKAQGVYVVIDIAYIDNGAYGGVFPHRWVRKHDFRRDLLLNDAGRDHWKQLLATMLGTKNPYTGIAPIADPSLLALVLSNEGGAAEMAFREGKGWSGGIPTAYAEPFRKWVQDKYKTDARWRAAWPAEIRGGESLGTEVRLPERLREGTSRNRDFMRFVVETEQASYRFMDAEARALGFKGLTTAFNNWAWLQSDITRSAAEVVDMHAYHAHPTGFVEAGSKVAAESSLPRAGAYVRELIGSRQWGKPFIVTEYGHAFWNAWRREAGVLVPAYAALQDWDLLTQFSENSLQLSYEPPQPSRRAAIFPFTISTDPIRRSAERLAALLYARQDVRTAKSAVEYRLDPQKELERNGAWSQLSEAATRLGFVTAVGVRFGAQGGGRRADLTLGADDVVVDKSRAGGAVFGPSASALLNKATKILPASRAAEFSRERYASDTGELLLDAKLGRFSIATARTVALVTKSAPDREGPVTLQRLTRPAVVAMSSMDGSELGASRRVLLFLLTDAINTGMEFMDDGRTTIKTLGSLPALIEPVTLSARLATTRAGEFKLYALSQKGERVDEVPVRRDGSALEFTIDTAALAGGPATMFELVADAP